MTLTAISDPSEVLIMKREFFNRWYGLKSYYIALTFSTLPYQVSLGTRPSPASLWRAVHETPAVDHVPARDRFSTPPAQPAGCGPRRQTSAN